MRTRQSEAVRHLTERGPSRGKHLCGAKCRLWPLQDMLYS